MRPVNRWAMSCLQRLCREGNSAIAAHSPGSSSPSASSVVVRWPRLNGGLVGFVVVDDVVEQSRGVAEADHQHAGGHRVERAGMADAFHVQGAAHGRDHVVAGDALRRLVDDQQTGVCQASSSSSQSSTSTSS